MKISVMSVEGSACWLIGTGYMAKEYVRVLKALEIAFTVVARSESSAEKFSDESNSIDIEVSLLSAGKKMELGDCAIVAVPSVSSVDVCLELIKCGVTKILVEKPAVISPEELQLLTQVAQEELADIYIAYNRRYYNSVSTLRKLVKSEGGIQSFTFEFTEWVDRINTSKYRDRELGVWAWMNSFHVIDLAFHLGGYPRNVFCHHLGALAWHKGGSAFSGSGITDAGAVFSYIANWDAPGRWGIECCTRDTRYVLRPLEKLFLVKRNSIECEEYRLGKEDEEFKAGLLAQTRAFLDGTNSSYLCDLKEQAKLIQLCKRMFPYWQ